jgi:hypothetical protein
MMRRVRAPPQIIWRKGYDTQNAANPIIRKTVAKEGSVPAIVLNQEKAKQEACGR